MNLWHNFLEHLDSKMLTCKYFVKFFELWDVLINEKEQSLSNAIKHNYLNGMRSECRVNGEWKKNRRLKTKAQFSKLVIQATFTQITKAHMFWDP